MTSDEQSEPTEAPEASAGHHERAEGQAPTFDVTRDPTPGVPDHAAPEDGDE